MAPERRDDGPLLRARALRVEAQGSVLLRDAEIAVDPREVLILVGETGSGKTSLLDALSGMSSHDVTGVLTVLGEDGLCPGTMRRLRGGRLGVLQQDIRGWYTPYRRVGPQILEGWAVDPTTGRAQVGAVLDRLALPLERVWSRFPNQLSDGMLRRAALAGLLARGPALVIADEPTAGLDGPTRWRAWELLLESGAAVVAATHDRAQLAALTAQGRTLRIKTIVKGTLCGDGTPGDWYGR
ncbi:MAG: ATP-binding cassette domain-containing protein [Pseudomonadota bacterium]